MRNGSSGGSIRSQREVRVLGMRAVVVWIAIVVARKRQIMSFFGIPIFAMALKMKIVDVVWAARFTAALLKKHSSSTYLSTEVGEGTKSEASLSKTQQKEPLLIETVLLVVFEKLFSFLLNLPDVNELLEERVAMFSRPIFSVT
ncbi:unnamed protein product [Camellia sinensis]